ncbi:M16 family metallopeptidase [Lactobacillus sp. PSON]|uniref:M16 family metallopeptidase n=1 Tax=Lactobacillus sp. PSON TaxID=3455454 RepID=UPI004043619A
MIPPKIIKHEYDSGFKSEIVLKPHFNQKFFGIIVDFGSSDKQKLAGSAHFLEHKLFAKKDGDISHKFEEIGADVNAFTSYNETMYYCIGVNNTKKLIELLFELVGEPAFTKENVEKEKPIIQQELAMYQDEPNWSVGNTIMKSMFGDSNLGIDVAGTKESISAMTAKTLTKVYNNNYFASNLRFIACGDFSDNQIKTIKQTVNKLQKKYFNEFKKPDQITHPLGNMESHILQGNGNSNIFGIGIRLKNFKKVLASKDLAQTLLEIMLESRLSVMTPWFEEMKNKGLISNPLQMSVNYTRQGNFITIFGISENAQELILEIQKQLQKDLSEDELKIASHIFELQKKEWQAQSARSLDNISYLAIELAEENLDDEDFFENGRTLQTMNFDNYVKNCHELMKDAEFCSAYLKSAGEK